MFRGNSLRRQPTRRLTGLVALSGAFTLGVTGLAVAESGPLAGASTKAALASSPGRPLSHDRSTHVVAATSPALSITGSSFAAPAIQSWVDRTAKLFGLNVNWQVQSSVIGLNEFGARQVDVAASDIPYSSHQAQITPAFPYQYVPDVAGGLSFMFNLTGKDSHRITDLVLDAKVIDQIFLGMITAWNAPSIARINPQLAGDLPSSRIIPVYRTDGSGENYLLSDYLLHEDGANFTLARNAFGAGGTLGAGNPSVTWPTPTPGTSYNKRTYAGWAAGFPVGQNGSANAATYASALSNKGAITYVGTAYAKKHKMPVASLLNAGGDAVQPTPTNVGVALQEAQLSPDLTQNLTKVYSDTAADAYPLSAYSYLVTPCSPKLASAEHKTCDGTGTSNLSAAKGSILGNFIDYMVCAGQKPMAALGFTPLPKHLVEDDFEAVGRLQGGVQPPAPTAANCDNPTITPDRAPPQA